MPGIGGAYGGYVGMTGSWSYWLGCHGGFLAWSSANSAQADTNYTKYGQGIGTVRYWFMGGPGVDPGYNGTAAEAAAWGARQAARTLINMANGARHLPGRIHGHRIARGCARVRQRLGGRIQLAVQRDQETHRLARRGPGRLQRVLELHRHPLGYKVGVYAAPGIWTPIFGTGSAASIPHTYEWTYEPETASLANAPPGWCLKSGGCAEFFGGVTSSSPYALMWQWSGGGGVSNAIGDFDQIDGAGLGG